MGEGVVEFSFNSFSLIYSDINLAEKSAAVAFFIL